MSTKDASGQLLTLAELKAHAESAIENAEEAAQSAAAILGWKLDQIKDRPYFTHRVMRMLVLTDPKYAHLEPELTTSFRNKYLHLVEAFARAKEANMIIPKANITPAKRSLVLY